MKHTLGHGKQQRVAQALVEYETVYLEKVLQDDFFEFLAAIAALYRTMSIRPLVRRLVGRLVRHQRVSKLVILLQNNSTMHNIHTMHSLQFKEHNA